MNYNLANQNGNRERKREYYIIIFPERTWNFISIKKRIVNSVVMEHFIDILSHKSGPTNKQHMCQSSINRCDQLNVCQIYLIFVQVTIFQPVATLTSTGHKIEVKIFLSHGGEVCSISWPEYLLSSVVTYVPHYVGCAMIEHFIPIRD